MIIWRRWGILVVFLALLGLGTGLLLQAGLQRLGVVEEHADHLAHRSENLFVGLGWLIGGGFIWLFDRYVLGVHLDKPQLYCETVQLDPPQLLPDGQLRSSFERPLLAPPPQSSLFFVPFKYWWIVFVTLGLVVIAVNALRPAF